jgi:hypothetical protein
MDSMRQISFDLSENEFKKFMTYFKRSLKSAQNLKLSTINSNNLNDDFGLTEEHQKIVAERIERLENGLSSTHSWTEIKANLSR